MSRKRQLLPSVIDLRRKEGIFDKSSPAPPVFDTDRDVRITNPMSFFFQTPLHPLRIGTEIIVQDTFKRNGKSFISSLSLLMYAIREWKGEWG
ncbi:hypothetical protein CEXT_730521 [Caerostris extrusa]|uniref:Uncharacterized protein n=1 Tax=Caerostris extrusa TaxID=172846 RepID=A0AAV4NCS6_CAEEX|nr:hypothetical protein CEXT_730521 [Caerostris extrusa]